MRSRTEKALVVICSLLAIAQAVLVTYFGYANFYRDYHAALLIVAMLLGGLLSSAVSCVFHELGHILFGKICGFRFNALHVWFFHIVKSGGKMRIRFGRMPEGEAGSAEMLPMSSEKMRSRYCLVTAGGLIFSFFGLSGRCLRSFLRTVRRLSFMRSLQHRCRMHSICLPATSFRFRIPRRTELSCWGWRAEMRPH